MSRRLAAIAALSLLAATVGPAPGRATEPILLGILESLPPNQATRIQEAYGLTEKSVVRVAFRRGDRGWEAFPSNAADIDQLRNASQQFPAKGDWTVAFDGKSLGHMESARPSQWQAYSDIGLQLPVPGQRLPHVGAPGSAFAQWGADGAVYRPLILVSQPAVLDPDHWQLEGRDDSLAGRGLDEFRTAVKKENPKLDVSAGNVELLKAYRSRAGALLFALVLTGKAPPPDEVPGPEWTPHWFLAEGPDSLKFLGSEMMLIDAGDYDGDGHSELVFAKSSYDYDGYLLFFDDFQHSAEFGWSNQ